MIPAEVKFQLGLTHEKSLGGGSRRVTLGLRKKKMSKPPNPVGALGGLR